MSRRRRALSAGFRAVLRLEGGEVLRSRWLLFSAIVFAVLAVVFARVGMSESLVVGYTGTGRVLFSFVHLLVLVLPLLALLGSALVVNRAREDGTLEMLLSLPISRAEYFAGVGGVRFAALALPFVVFVAGIALYGWLAWGAGVPWGFLGQTLAVGLALIAGFTAVGFLVSTVVRHQAKALLVALAIWMLAVGLLDFALVGAMLRWRLPAPAVFLIAAANPAQAARMALLATAEPDLTTLGPVGFFLAHRVGPVALSLLGVLWPLGIGAVAWLVSLRVFRRGDAI